MNPLQIEYFLSVAQTKSVAQSSRELFVSAPAISKQLTALERDLGVTLLTRSHTGMALTPAGEEYYEFFAKTFAQLSALKRHYHVQADATLNLSLGILKDWAIYERLHELEQRLKEIFPQLTLTILPMPEDALIEALSNSKLDMVLSMPNRLASDLGTNQYVSETKLCTVQKVVVYAQYLFGSKPGTPKITDFADKTMYSVSNQSRRSAALADTLICKHYGFQPKLAPEEDLNAALAKVGMGHGFTILDKWSAFCYFPELHSIPVDYHNDVSLFTHQQLKAPFRNTIAQLAQAIFKQT